jgi:hypothetical protein
MALWVGGELADAVVAGACGEVAPAAPAAGAAVAV